MGYALSARTQHLSRHFRFPTYLPHARHHAYHRTLSSHLPVSTLSFRLALHSVESLGHTDLRSAWIYLQEEGEYLFIKTLPLGWLFFLYMQLIQLSCLYRKSSPHLSYLTVGYELHYVGNNIIKFHHDRSWNGCPSKLEMIPRVKNSGLWNCPNFFMRTLICELFEALGFLHNYLSTSSLVTEIVVNWSVLV